MTVRQWRVALVGWLVLIFLFSSSLFSADNTSQVLVHDGLNVFIRKCAHMVEYAILMYLWFRSLCTVSDRFSRSIVLGVVLSVLYAMTDEWHQSFVPSRDGTIVDVGWDAAGAVCMGLVLWFIKVRGTDKTKRAVLGFVGQGEGVYNTGDAR